MGNNLLFATMIDVGGTAGLAQPSLAITIHVAKNVSLILSLINYE